MSENARDTQFAGFAKLLWQDIRQRSGDHWEGCEEILAQRAYDLVAHTCDSCSEQEDLVGSRMMPDGLLSNIPDMTTWPENEEWR